MEGSASWPLVSAALTHGDRTAIVAGERSVTYAEVLRRAGGFAAGLDELGIPAGARVAVLLPNTLEHLELWLAIPSFGRVLTTLNTRLTVPELVYMLEDSAAEALVVDDSTLATGLELRERCGGLHTLIHTGPGATPAGVVAYDALLTRPAAAVPEVDSDAVAAIMYTGGTTGFPKGVMLTHANLLANSKHLFHTINLDREDSFLYAGPLFHMAAAQTVLPLTWVGGTHVMMDRFTPAAFVEAVTRHGVTSTLLVPTMIQMLIDHLAEHPADMSSLRLLHYGASPMSRQLLARAMDVLGCDFVQGYGMTEAAPQVAYLPPRDHRLAVQGIHEERLGSVGYPVPGVQLQVRAPDGTPVEPGTVGELWVRGPNIMAGYLNREEETAQALVDGWYRTGDGGYQDADGYVFLVDRLKDMIISGGENVYSMEVELVIARHPAVAEVVVVGVPDPTWGERVHAIVVLHEGASADAESLIAHCREHLAGFKVPKSIDIRSAQFPKSGAGKILKHEVRHEVIQSITSPRARGQKESQ